MISSYNRKHILQPDPSSAATKLHTANGSSSWSLHSSIVLSGLSGSELDTTLESSGYSVVDDLLSIAEGLNGWD